jgi:23S rRNA pseudouridine1911/1915/1917 synthase
MTIKNVYFTKIEDAGTRIDQFIYNKLEGKYTHTQVKRFIAAGCAKIAYKKIDDPSHLLDKKQKITFDFDPEFNYPKVVDRKKGRRVTILHEDNDIIVVEKDSGVLSVPTRKREKDTVIHQINNYIKKKYNRKHSVVFIVHRLDQGTSGVLVFAKHQKAQEILKKQFLTHSIHRKYIAISEGLFKEKVGRIESQLVEDDEAHIREFKMKSSDDPTVGKKAVTHYRVLKEIQRRYSYVEAKLETGKRNQIRVHLSEAGHPVMGDKKYGKSRKTLFHMPRLALHAKELGFIHPSTKKFVQFTSTEPVSFKRFLAME